MIMWKKSPWSLGLLVGAGAWAIVEMLANTHRRKRARIETANDLQEWENEGGAPPPAVTKHQ